MDWPGVGLWRETQGRRPGVHRTAALGRASPRAFQESE